MARAESMVGFANQLAGNHLVAQRHFETGLRHLTSGSRSRAAHDLYDPTGGLLVGMARSLLYRGVLGQSLDYARLAIVEAEKSSYPAMLCRNLIVTVPVYLVLGDWQRSEQRIAQLTDLSAAHSLKLYQAIAAGMRGRWLLLQNNIRDGVALLKRASETRERARLDEGEGRHSGVQIGQGLSRSRKQLAVIDRVGKASVRRFV
jgi:hypothetical protein